MSKERLSSKQIEKLVKMGRLIPLVKQTKDGKPYLAGYTRKSTSRKRYQRFLLPEADSKEAQIYNTADFTSNVLEGTSTMDTQANQPEVISLFDAVEKGGK